MVRIHPAYPLGLLRHLNVPINTIIDVGVQSSTPCLKSIFPDKLHILFEPCSDYWNKIEESYKNIKHILYKIALFSEDKIVNMEESGGLSRITDNNKIEAIQVQANKLDTILNDTNFEKPYLLKLDVDGAELEILEGAQETLKDCSTIFIEAHPRDYLERCNAIEKYGFKLFDIVDFRYYDNRLSQFDLVFIKKDLLPHKKQKFDVTKWKTLR
jgi:FkbM family methyltransferase